MLDRKAYEFLKEWRARKHKCLLIKGMRQVGKTFIVDKFGETYDNYVNIPLNKAVNRTIFKDKANVDEVIKDISLRFRDVSFVPGKTLIFLDEIQGCPEARQMLKDFTIDGRYDVIASGSLLGIDVFMKEKKEEESDEPRPLLPMGYEEQYVMRSLDFEEFLWAVGVSEEHIRDAKESIAKRKPLSETALDVFTKAFKQYMVVGGMPESVQAFVDGDDYSGSDMALEDVLRTCKEDITRYNSNSDGIKTLKCFESIPRQLSQSNKRFMYSRIEEGSKSRGSQRKFSDNLLWIEYAGYGNFVHAVSQLTKPLHRNELSDLFKVYLSDTGLLAHMSPDSEDLRLAISTDDTSYNMGEITENIVAECLVKSGFTPYYYRKTNGEGRMELDFVLARNRKIIVIEVKSGRSREAPSLDVVDSRFKVDRKIMFENANIGVDGKGVEHYPLFAAAFMDSIEPLVKVKKEKIAD